MPLAKRILFSGSIAGHAVGYGGNTWAFLQWILGFRRLGFDVYYVEERQGKDLMDEDLKPAPFAKSANAQSFRRLIDRFELGDRACSPQRVPRSGPGPYADLAGAVRRRHAPAGTRPLSHDRPEPGRAGLPLSDLRSSLGEDPVADRA